MFFYQSVRKVPGPKSKIIKIYIIRREKQDFFSGTVLYEPFVFLVNNI